MSLTTPDPTRCYVQVLNKSAVLRSGVQILQTMPNGALLLDGPADQLAVLVSDLAKTGDLLDYERFGVALEQRFSQLIDEVQ